MDPGLDIGAVLLLPLLAAPAGYSRLRRTAVWCTVIAYVLAGATYYWKRG